MNRRSFFGRLLGAVGLASAPAVAIAAEKIASRTHSFGEGTICGGAAECGHLDFPPSWTDDHLDSNAQFVRAGCMTINEARAEAGMLHIEATVIDEDFWHSLNVGRRRLWRLR